eukprot:CAMPEP_0181175724 /NCGR_PEP_ID=MMETSP1096-20121128/4236_1 /TAXON_ID=156174 ORGANISM="Chrysochromulina ericina, Strain CCMP281" /NCGR_SAMPLE_ID=MMETSP1096 /ASSEMBLY_ACC=CAM_ASM_000453 /LENGTH=222 /DNA_ID=CAMNT_0023263739 /DNA_START=39 /DNA_END=703 /DNA_ORIENTATION=+
MQVQNSHLRHTGHGNHAQITHTAATRSHKDMGCAGRPPLTWRRAGCTMLGVAPVWPVGATDADTHAPDDLSPDTALTLQPINAGARRGMLVIRWSSMREAAVVSPRRVLRQGFTHNITGHLSSRDIRTVVSGGSVYDKPISVAKPQPVGLVEQAHRIHDVLHAAGGDNCKLGSILAAGSSGEDEPPARATVLRHLWEARSAMSCAAGGTPGRTPAHPALRPA